MVIVNSAVPSAEHLPETEMLSLLAVATAVWVGVGVEDGVDVTSATTVPVPVPVAVGVAVPSTPSCAFLIEEASVGVIVPLCGVP